MINARMRWNRSADAHIRDRRLTTASRTWASALLFAISCLFAASQLHAYTFSYPTGTWPCGEVLMEPHLGSSGPLSDGSASWDAVADTAMAIWNANLYNVRFTTWRRTGNCYDLDGHNDICWKPELEEPELTDAIAITWRWIDRTASKVVEADIVLNQDLLWDSYRGPKCDLSRCMPEYDLRRVLLHELGHVIGLGHEDDVPAIMSTRASNLDHLTSDDINGGRALYPFESQYPWVYFTAPESGTRVTNQQIEVRGLAGDNCLVSHISLQVNNGAFQTISNSHRATRINWSTDVTLQPGTNLLKAIAYDAFTNQSPVARHSLYYVVRSPLNIQVQGSGTVSPAWNGKLLEIGRGYEIAASPAEGNLFVDWRDGSGTVLSTKPTLTFLMQSNLVLRAQFITNPFPRVAGSYNGLFYKTNGVTHDSSGFLQLTLGGNGAYSAVMKSAGKTNRFTGKFHHVQGTSTKTVLRGKTALTFQMNLDLTGSSDLLSGTVQSTGWVASLQAYRFGFSSTNPATNLAGQYTVSLFAANDAEPYGYGFAAATVDLNGKAKLTGKLGDGQPIKHSASISKGGLWPLYVPLYGGKGTILNWVYFAEPYDIADSAGTWLRPATTSRYYPNGFTNVATTIGSLYQMGSGIRPLDCTNAVVIFSGGNLLQPLTNSVMLSDTDQFVNTDTNSLTIKLSTNGLFTGSVRFPGFSRSTPFEGTLLQKQNTGSGFFLGTNQSGRVVIQPTP